MVQRATNKLLLFRAIFQFRTFSSPQCFMIFFCFPSYCSYLCKLIPPSKSIFDQDDVDCFVIYKIAHFIIRQKLVLFRWSQFSLAQYFSRNDFIRFDNDDDDDNFPLKHFIHSAFFCHFIFNISLDVRENFSISLIFILWFLVNSADVAAIVFVVCCRWRCCRLTSQSFSHLIFSYKSIVMKTSANVTLCLFWWMKQKCLVCVCGLGAWKCHVCAFCTTTLEAHLSRTFCSYRNQMDP